MCHQQNDYVFTERRIRMAICIERNPSVNSWVAGFPVVIAILRKRPNITSISSAEEYPVLN
jgi:hypothetical protein